MRFTAHSNLLYKDNSSNGDYLVQVNFRIFEKWAAENLISNLSKKVVVIIDNILYHSVQLNKVLNHSIEKMEL